MLNDRGVSQELLEATIVKAKALIQSKSPAPIIRRKSLSDIAQIIRPFRAYPVSLMSSASAKDAKVLMSAGPKFGDLPAFFNEVICSQVYPVTNIIAVGSHLSYGNDDDQDFYDYCLEQRKKPQRYQTPGNFYEVAIDCPVQAAGSFSVTVEINKVTLKPIKKNCVVTGIQYSTLTVDHGYPGDTKTDTRKVNVTVVAYDPKKDELSFRKQDMKSLWKIVENMQRQNSLFHDTIKGKGYAGQIILMMEIVRNFNKIFQPQPSSSLPNGPVDLETTAAAAAASIYQIFADLCSDRKELIASISQFEHAIQGANLMYVHRDELEKVAVITPQPTGLSPKKPVRTLSAPALDRNFGVFTNQGMKACEAQVLASTLTGSRKAVRR